tara:strand:- start:1146 stop:1682 length:537 start_codon:yes stop_codon:yes gene_type:complete
MSEIRFIRLQGPNLVMAHNLDRRLQKVEEAYFGDYCLALQCVVDLCELRYKNKKEEQIQDSNKQTEMMEDILDYLHQMSQSIKPSEFEVNQDTIPIFQGKVMYETEILPRVTEFNERLCKNHDLTEMIQELKEQSQVIRKLWHSSYQEILSELQNIPGCGERTFQPRRRIDHPLYVTR